MMKRNKIKGIKNNNNPGLQKEVLDEQHPHHEEGNEEGTEE